MAKVSLPRQCSTALSPHGILPLLPHFMLSTCGNGWGVLRYQLMPWLCGRSLISLNQLGQASRGIHRNPLLPSSSHRCCAHPHPPFLLHLLSPQLPPTENSERPSSNRRYSATMWPSCLAIQWEGAAGRQELPNAIVLLLPHVKVELMKRSEESKEM